MKSGRLAVLPHLLHLQGQAAKRWEAKDGGKPCIEQRQARVGLAHPDGVCGFCRLHCLGILSIIEAPQGQLQVA